MHMRAAAVAGVARAADDLPLTDRLPHGDADARLVAVAGRQRAGVLDARVVAVAADPAGDRHATRGRRADRRADRHRDVDAGMDVAGALLAEHARDRPADRPDEAARPLPDRSGDAGPSAAQARDDCRLLALERLHVRLEIVARGARRSQQLGLVGAHRLVAVALVD